MRVLVLNGGANNVAAIHDAIRAGAIEFVAEPPEAVGARFVFARWSLDAATRDLIAPDGRPVHLTSLEFDLLMAFVTRPGRALSRADLTNVLKGRDWNYFDRSLDTLVGRLRRKLAGTPSLIRSVRGVGYVFCAAVRRVED